MKRYAFIFDLDGTLLNTLADIGNACNEILIEYGFPPHDLDEYSRMIGNGFARLVERAVSPEKLPPVRLEEIVKKARGYYNEHMTNFTRPYSGITQALTRLAQKGAYLAVFSNKPDNMTVALIAHYFPRIPFAWVAGAKDGVPLKPDPQVLTEAIVRDGLDKNATFYIGDTHIDMETARNAGCVPIGAAWGFRGKNELVIAGAEGVLEAPPEIPSLLEK